MQVLLLLKCKDINSELREAIDDQLLPKDIKKEERDKFFTFVREHQSNVLLVLDGLDELPTHKLSVYNKNNSRKNAFKMLLSGYSSP